MSYLQVLVISLKHSIDRREKVFQEMKKTQFQWRFLDAVDGSQLDMTRVAYDAAKVKRLLGFELTPKEIGCYLSHMMAWQSCVNNDQPTLIFEDDFVLLSHFESVLSKLLSEPQKWEIVRLQALCDSPDSIVVNYGAFRLVQNERDPLGATAYLVQPSAAKRLIQHSIEIYEPVDHFIEHHEKHGMRMLAIKPYPVQVVDPTRATSTISDRPDRRSIRGFNKFKRSLNRLLDRSFSTNPWFPK